VEEMRAVLDDDAFDFRFELGISGHESRRKETLIITTVINGIHELFDLSIVVNEVIIMSA